MQIAEQQNVGEWMRNQPLTGMVASVASTTAATAATSKTFDDALLDAGSWIRRRLDDVDESVVSRTSAAE